MMWLAEQATIRLAAKNATRIRRAFRMSFNGQEIADKWAETHPAGGSVPPQMARDWARAQIVVNKTFIQNALARTYAEGYVLGEVSATAMLALVLGIKKAPTNRQLAVASVVNWETWKPGNRAAAALLKPKGGLESLLATRKITIADEVVNTKLNRIGTILAKALEQGKTPKETSVLVDEVINDPQHALVISQTEMSRAVSVASRDLYEESNVEEVEWLVAEGCDICQENADASPIGIGDTFPSGDSEPPAHPNCMCALAPYVVV